MLRTALRAISAGPALALALAGALVAPAPAAQAARSFPVPSCGWASAGFVSRTLGDGVRTLAPVWKTQLAPVLTCEYVERIPHLQVGDVPVAAVQFRELQRVRPPKGAVSVANLGSCVSATSCPTPGHPAWLVETQGVVAATAKPYARAEALEVQDGLDQITIIVDNPNGPFPVASETAALERLARALLPRFYWS